MKPLRLNQLLIRGLWFVALLAGIFFVIDRLRSRAYRNEISRTHFVPDTVMSWEQPFAPVPDTLFFAGEQRTFLRHDFMREHLRLAYYHWTSPAAPFLELLQRRYRYGALLDSAFAYAALPRDFLALAAARSHLQLMPTNPSSCKQTAGLWGLSPPETRSYGLRVDSTIDQRLDVFATTIAIASQLKHWRNQTNSWYGALQHSCAHRPAAVAEVLVLHDLLAAPQRHRRHLPPRHRSRPLRFQIHRLKQPTSDLWDYLAQHKLNFAPPLDTIQLLAYNPALHHLPRTFPAGYHLLLPPKPSMNAPPH